jgi:DeoR family fructose operon transcriptional repressor
VENLTQVFANKAILGVDGISLRHGCTVPSNVEAEIIRQMIKQTRGEIIIVADHSKWGVVSNFQIAAIGEISRFICDPGLDPIASETLMEHGVKIHIASAHPVGP